MGQSKFTANFNGSRNGSPFLRVLFDAEGGKELPVDHSAMKLNF